MPVENHLVALLLTFLASMLPVLELRAGIPMGIAMGLPALPATLAGILGNTVQIYLAVVVIGWAYRMSRRIPRVARWLGKTEQQVGKHTKFIQRWGWIGLAIFVGLPLPGSGVWGGVVLSRLLGLTGGPLWAGLSVGVAIAGAVMGLASHGTFALIRLF
jgi:uncharacterized membrane protein